MPDLYASGQTGQEVCEIQAALNFHVGRYAVPLVPDGIFGPLTDARLRMFQKRAQLVADGIVGPKTTRTFYQYCEPTIELSFTPRDTYGFDGFHPGLRPPMRFFPAPHQSFPGINPLPSPDGPSPFPPIGRPIGPLLPPRPDPSPSADPPAKPKTAAKKKSKNKVKVKVNGPGEKGEVILAPGKTPEFKSDKVTMGVITVFNVPVFQGIPSTLEFNINQYGVFSRTYDFEAKFKAGPKLTLMDRLTLSPYFMLGVGAKQYGYYNFDVDPSPYSPSPGDLTVKPYLGGGAKMVLTIVENKGRPGWFPKVFLQASGSGKYLIDLSGEGPGKFSLSGGASLGVEFQIEKLLNL